MTTAEEHQVPADAQAPPPGCEWKHSEALAIGDTLYAGVHDLFGIRQPCYVRITHLDPKPKTIYAILAPTHPRLLGAERRRFSRDEWLAVLTERAA